MNEVAWREFFCVETSGSNVDFAEARQSITNLLVSGNPEWDYHGLNYNHIYLQYGDWEGKSCDLTVGAIASPGVTDPGLAASPAAAQGFQETDPLPYPISPEEIVIRYYIRLAANLPDDPDHPCYDRQTGEKYSCVDLYQYHWSADELPDSPRGYKFADVFLKQETYTTTLQTHLVNHETGHVFGLADGGPLSNPPHYGCPQSIMHPQYPNIALYGCDGRTLNADGHPYPYVPPLDWPTDGDLDSIFRITLGQRVQK
jgi:hypothetical protein